MRWLVDARVWLRGGLAAAAVALVFYAGGLEWLEQRGLNHLFELRGPRPPLAPIVLVSVDDDSFQELGLPWPWPRALHGQLIELLAEGRPAAIGMDILFVEPSGRGPEDDEALAAAIARAGNVVLAAALTRVSGDVGVRERLEPPLPGIRQHAAAFGPVNLGADNDAFVRRAALRQPFQGRDLASFDLEVHRVATAAGVPSRPLPGVASVVINYRGGPQSFPRVPYYRIVTGEIPPETFRGKIVLVGATSPTLHDVFPTPFAPHGGMPGVEIHANVLETLFQGDRVVRLPSWATALLALAAGMLAAWSASALRPLMALVPVLGALAGYLLASVLLFTWADAWLDQAAVPLTLALAYGATLVENVIQAQREKQRLSRFFSPAVLREVVRKGQDLGRSRRLITVLFSDIRGFTPIAERLSPEEVAEFLRDYMTTLTEVVFRHGGTVTQFVGDEIMVLYNAPFDQPAHAEQAVRTALEFQERVRELSDRWSARCGSPIRNGVGINTGDAVVGIVGSAQRVEYGAIGDTINLGSRLEGLTKEFQAPIIISDSTHERVKELFSCRSLGEVSVKGKAHAVKIYGVQSGGRARAQRVTLGSPLTIRARSLDAEISVEASLSDLSLTGLRAAGVPRHFDDGQMVVLRFALPALARAIETEGRVMWSTEEQVGIRFLQLSPEDEVLLDEFLRSSDAARPA
jgi:adenylate cyclase